jgi:hypothetical protein
VDLVLNPLSADPSGREVCGRSVSGIAGSNSAGRMDVSSECRVLSGLDLWSRAREVLPSAVHLSVMVKPR